MAARRGITVNVPLMRGGERVADLEDFEVRDGDLGDLTSQLYSQPNAPVEDVSLQSGSIVIRLSDKDPSVEGVHAVANTVESWVGRRTPYSAGSSFVAP